MKKMCLKLLPSILFAIISTISAPAQCKEPPLLDMKKVMASAADVTREKYPDADYILLDDCEYVEYHPDGNSEAIDENYIKVLTEKGRRDLSARTMHFNAVYEAIEVLAVEIIKPDLRVVPVNVKEQSQEMVNPGQMGMNIYDPNQKVFRVNIPALEIGDTIRFVMREKMIKSRVPNTWSDMFGLESGCPILNYTLEILAPEKLPLAKKVIRDSIAGTVQEEVEDVQGGKLYRWRIRNVPQMFPEPDMPDYYTVIQRLLVSTIPDWQFVSRWYWNLSLPHIEKTSPEMKEKVRELVNGIQDERKRLEAVFYFVSQKINYRGLTTEKEAPGYEPQDVDLTFSTLSGVCRDKAALLVAMLREAGFKAYPVLIMQGTKKDPEVPNPFFNHAIVCAEDRDGSYILMDPTDENTKELLPAYLCDKSYLVAKPEGDVLRTSPIIPADENLMLIETKASVNESGVMLVETEMKFGGINDNNFRGYFARMTPDKRVKVFESIVKGVLPSAKLIEVELRPERMEDVSIPMSASIKYMSDDVMAEGEGALLMDIPWIGTRIGMVNYVIGQTGLEKRKYPLETGIACGSVEKIEIEMQDAAGLSPELPEYSDIDNELFKWKRSLSMDGKILRGEGVLKLKVVEFSPEQYLKLRDFLKTMEIDFRKKPIFETRSPFAAGAKSEEDDIMLLSENKQYEISPEGTVKMTATVRKKILTYAGKKNNSELKLSFNPAWDELKLEYARVASPSGAVKEISAREINMMDQEWVASAPRYPAGKILVASLSGVELGSVVEYRFVQHMRKRPFVSISELFRYFSPAMEKCVTLKFPAEQKHMTRDFNTEDSGIESKSGKGEYQWSVKDVPPLKRESDIPPSQFFIPCKMFTNGDWVAYSGTVRETLVRQAEKQAAAAEKAVVITKALKDKRDKIRQIRDFVAVAIRGTGPNFCDLPLECVTAADKTLSDAYGNPADKAVLLYAMLKAIGVESEFVLGSDLPMLEILVGHHRSFPMYGIFGTVLVKVKGEDIYLNDTNEYAALGATVHDGYAGLFLETAEIREIKAAEGKSDRDEQKIDIRIDEKGDALITRETKYYGNAYQGFNQQFSEITPEEKRRYFQELCAEISQTATPVEDLFIDNKNYPGTQRVSVKVRNFATIDGNNMYFYKGNPLGFFDGNPPDKRENPYYIGGRLRDKTVCSISAPCEDVIISPSTRKFILNTLFKGVETSPAVLSMDFSKVTEGGKTTFNIIYDSSIDPCIVPADQMGEMLFINDELQNPDMETFLLKLKK